MTLKAIKPNSSDLLKVEINPNTMKIQMKLILLVWTICTITNLNAKVNNNTTEQQPIEVIQAEIKIYLMGGIVSAITQKEIDFGKKYHVIFLDFGCVPPSNLDYYEMQNFKSFDLLNIQFGPKWQEELKLTTLGFKKWKEKNK